MKSPVKTMRWLLVIVLINTIAGCSDNTELSRPSKATDISHENLFMDVYKSPNCGCCGKWVEHVETAGFKTVTHHPENLSQLKADKGIAPRHQSCHTAVSKDGYVFEGHIPIDVIQRFLANPPPDAIGLAVPGMPIGSPGMEMGNRKDAYDVLLLTKNGNSIYEKIIGNH